MDPSASRMASTVSAVEILPRIMAKPGVTIMTSSRAPTVVTHNTVAY